MAFYSFSFQKQLTIIPATLTYVVLVSFSSGCCRPIGTVLGLSDAGFVDADGVCGDGRISATEECDDGNHSDGDGCSTECTVEPGWTCENEPSDCRCKDYYQGEHCEVCRVFVDLNSTSQDVDGKLWQTAYDEIQPGIDKAEEQETECQVWVAKGNYNVYVDSPEDRILLKGGVHLYGGFNGTETERNQRNWRQYETVLDGASSVNGDERVFNVIDAVDVDSVSLDGFHITGGRAKNLPNARSELGGGIKVKSSSLEVRNCVVRGNQAKKGGGLFLQQSNVTIINSVFRGNEADVGSSGAIEANVDNSLLIKNSEFRDNTPGAISANASTVNITSTRFQRNGGDTTGGALSLGNCNFEIQDSVFSDNWTERDGGALRIGGSHSYEMVFRRCLFLRNNADYAGAVKVEGSTSGTSPNIRMENCVFAENSAGVRGGVVLISFNAILDLINCTIIQNTAGEEASMLNGNDTSTLNITNSILWENGTEPFVMRDQSQLNIRYSLVEGGYEGEGNIALDPLLRNSVEGDYTLQPTSPCIDAADGSMAPSLDMDGNSRCDVTSVIDEGIGNISYVDMGAYEYLSSECTTGL
jgi:cysteine-rich repeat protein